jgi:ferrous iron transport protein B
MYLDKNKSRPECGRCRSCDRRSAEKDIGAVTGKEEITVALAGQPNTGKSTIFNQLTGLNQKVGNWPGKTVDRKEGRVVREDRVYRLVDLPGTYGLNANSMEEEIARDYIVSGKPDVVVAVVNAASVERSIYLVSELAGLKVPIVIALNMMDVAGQEGRRVDARRFSAAIGLPVVPMTASMNQGVDQILETLDALELPPPQKRKPVELPSEVNQLSGLLDFPSSLPYPKEWAASKLIEGDHKVTQAVKNALKDEKRKAVETFLSGHKEAANAIIGMRQQWIDEACKKAVKDVKACRSPSEKWDRIFLHPLWGKLVAFLAISLSALTGILLGMFTGGQALYAALEGGPKIKAAWPGTLGSMMADGLAPALGWITALVFIIGFVYAIFYFLEDIGYLARISFLTDTFLRRIGAGGKSAIPLMLGLMCNAVAIAGTRVVETRRQRLVTIVMLPFLPCGGQTVVAAIFTLAIFPVKTAIIILIGLTIINVLFASLVGKLFGLAVPHPPADGMIMELPLFHRPNFRTIFGGVRMRIELFLRRAAGVIFFGLLIVWAVSYFPGGEIQTSYLYQFGRFLEPAGSMIGLDWRFMVALLSSFFAKEITAGTLAVLFSVSASDQQAIMQAVHNAISPAGALAFVVASHFYIPCLGSMAVLKSELGSWKKTLPLLAGMFILAFALAFITYHAAKIII